jgi:peptide/nickel transport system permease protein
MSSVAERIARRLAVRDNTAKVRGPESMGSMVWQRFRRHPGAIAGLTVLTILGLSVLLAPLSPYDPLASDMSSRLQPPSWQHPFGTDPLGRDLLTRALYGGRISLSVGLLVVAITLVIGVPVGRRQATLAAGWTISMRITDAALSLPSLLVLVLLGAILLEVDVLPGTQQRVNVAAVIGVLSWMTVARLVRPHLTIREMGCIIGAFRGRDLRIMSRHILSQPVGRLLSSPCHPGYAIMEEAGLSFLGFGIQPPTPVGVIWAMRSIDQALMAGGVPR